MTARLKLITPKQGGHICILDRMLCDTSTAPPMPATHTTMGLLAVDARQLSVKWISKMAFQTPPNGLRTDTIPCPESCLTLPYLSSFANAAVPLSLYLTAPVVIPLNILLSLLPLRAGAHSSHPASLLDTTSLSNATLR